MKHNSIILSLVLGLFWPVAHATDLVVGSVNPLSGALADMSAEIVSGAKAHFEAVNAKGGVNGNRVLFLVRDGGVRPDGAAKTTQDLIDTEKPLALLGIAGTAINEEILRQRILNQNQIPLLGPLSGGIALRKPVNPYLYNVRASYRAESAKLVKSAISTGAQRIAVFYQNDDFGEDGLTAVQAQLAKQNMTIVASGGYPTGTDQVKDALDTIYRAKPDAVVLFAANKAAAAFIKGMRDKSSSAQMLGVSTLNYRTLIATAGLPAIQNMVISQVVPSPANVARPIVKEYRENLKRYVPTAVPSYIGLESYISAKLLTEGLKRAGNAPTRASLQKALDGLEDFDAGGFQLRFGPNDREGSEFVDVAIVGSDGELRH